MDDVGRRPTVDRWVAVVAAVGVVTFAGFSWNLFLELDRFDVALPPLAVFLLGVALSSGVLAVAGWLATGDLDRRHRRTVALWTVGGGTAMLAVTAFTLTIRALEGRPLAEPQLDLLVNAEAGALAGAVVGGAYVRARRDRERAERARRTLSFLNRTLRHELLNGIQLVSGYARTVVDEGDGAAVDAGETILDVSDELETTIEDVQAVADVQAGDADREPLDLPPLVATEVDRARERYPHAEFSLSAPETLRVRATDALAHAVRNVLANAVEHNDREAPSVSVTVERRADAAVVAVTDDGPGMPDDVKAALGEPSEGGTHGFGLHLVVTLVEGYGGSVSARDADPRGTVVELALPSAEATDGGHGEDGDPGSGGGTDGDDSERDDVGGDGHAGDDSERDDAPASDSPEPLRTNP
jgi:signal transduction histidine kinase